MNYPVLRLNITEIVKFIVLSEQYWKLLNKNEQ
jgi:hypothetical protein